MTGAPRPDQDLHLYGVMVTYRRPEWLKVSLQRLRTQTRRLELLVVVDNDPRAENRALVDEHVRAGHPARYLPSGSNLGPAGGLAAGMTDILREASDTGWVMFFDDDDPPDDDRLVERLAEMACSLPVSSGNVGAVGAGGARVDARTGLFVRPGDDELSGAVPVDFIGGNQFPLYAVRAARVVGPPDPRLFFGCDDLEFGLRLRAAGFNLFSHGEMHWDRRQRTGRAGVEVRPDRELSGPPHWRKYYGIRNLVWSLRQHGYSRAARRVVLARAMSKPLRNAPAHPVWAARHLGFNARAVWDAYRGQLGLRIPPPSSHFAAVPDDASDAPSSEVS